MISIGDPEDRFDDLRLSEIGEDAHLCLKFADTELATHRSSPTREKLAVLIPWLDAQPKIEKLLVHCAAGISRSPAVALLSLCHLDPQTEPRKHMDTVAASSECTYIWPNLLVVELGDALLGKSGTIVKAVDDWRSEQEDQPFQFAP